VRPTKPTRRGHRLVCKTKPDGRPSCLQNEPVRRQIQNELPDQRFPNPTVSLP
jgi:hypothetical protein